MMENCKAKGIASLEMRQAHELAEAQPCIVPFFLPYPPPP